VGRGLIDDLLIGKVENLRCISFLNQHRLQGLHLHDVCFKLAKLLTEEKAILTTKVRALISAFVLSAKLPVVWPNHLDRLCSIISSPKIRASR
jgi:hypothetical protein